MITDRKVPSGCSLMVLGAAPGGRAAGGPRTPRPRSARRSTPRGRAARRSAAEHAEHLPDLVGPGLPDALRERLGLRVGALVLLRLGHLHRVVLVRDEEVGARRLEGGPGGPLQRPA